MTKKEFLELYSLFVFETDPCEPVYLDKKNLGFVETIFDFYMNEHGINIMDAPVDDH